MSIAQTWFGCVTGSLRSRYGNILWPGETVIPVFATETCPSDAREIHYIPTDIFIHFYGGGYINDAWGASRRMAGQQLLKLHEEVSPHGGRHVFMSGLQVSPGAELERWKPLLERAFYVLPVLDAGSGEGTGPLAAHVNLADYSCVDPKQRMRSIAQFLAAAARRIPESGRCEILVAYPEARIGEDAAGRELIEAYASLVAAGEADALTFTIRNLVEELVEGRCQFHASFLVTCSYHVTLTALLTDCPTVLLAENAYYRHKAAGLENIFHVLGADGTSSPQQTEELVEEAIRRRNSGSHARGAHVTAQGQLDKALYLAEISEQSRSARLAQDLANAQAAFRETALQLGELKRRRIVEEYAKYRAAEEARRRAEEEAKRRADEQTKYRADVEARRRVDEVTPQTVILLKRRRRWSDYLEQAYWVRTRNRFLKSARKRIDRALAS